MHSLSSDQVLLSIQLKTFQSPVDELLKFFAFELYYSFLHILIYRVGQTLFNFIFNSFEILLLHAWS